MLSPLEIDLHACNLYFFIQGSNSKVTNLCIFFFVCMLSNYIIYSFETLYIQLYTKFQQAISICNKMYLLKDNWRSNKNIACTD